MLRVIIQSILVLASTGIYGQSGLQKVFGQKMDLPESRDMGTQMLRMSESFLGTPYVGGTLEGNPTERLVCKFDGLDCTTLVESSVALAVAKSENPTFEGYKNELTKLRYREGNIDGYPSRLHYVLDWMYENQKRGRLEDITEKVGGIPYKKEINFMTNHANLYPAMASGEVWEKIKEQENMINSREHSYIPKEGIQKAEPMLHNGDIVAFTSSVEGLDVNHMGVITKMGSRAYLIHASLSGKKVIMSSVPLAEYVASVPKHTGMIVARLNDI
ncbi:N-acetylmuramoyl-L-alanine amidase-like domain-containing protein [Dyadobacter arcticus]|uniref:Cell wall-associated NlpC family hydrolase n=1 Tax=Dyadobacter arcticus TaxID=1078754 RepID=A0ABX0UMY1_9BACT|nr:N-acetylmuramoyl-L-alanine amidase-like domain-containing protein [Dyadobacter arcticus]NIJ53334.1 cell wall-associated NlpC family hydrolase [Dyadobacter arcticus]